MPICVAGGIGDSESWFVNRESGRARRKFGFVDELGIVRMLV
jgi:hypothetical protein